MKLFEIKIIDQYWIEKDLNDPNDLCSHGLIQLNINGMTISDDKDDDWTIATSGLQLLRSVKFGHKKNIDQPMILHCGYLDMINCTIGIDWNVERTDRGYFLSDFTKCPTNSFAEETKYDGLQANVKSQDYITEIINFCNEIKGFYKDKPRIFEEDFDEIEWNNFWNEFYEIYEQFK